MHVTAHAAHRFIERVDPSLTVEQATAVMLGAHRAVQTSVDFACSTVRMGCGAKLILRGDTVVTVLTRNHINISDMPEVRR